MSTLDRLITLVVAALLLVTSTLIGLTMFGEVTFVRWLNSLATSKVDGILVIIILGLLAVYLALMITKSDTDKRAIVRNTTLGDIRISTQTIIGLVTKTVKDMQGIREVNVTINEVEPIRLTIDVQLLPDFHIPQLTESVQTKVQDYLQNIVGIDVTSVNVAVTGIKNDPKARVE